MAQKIFLEKTIPCLAQHEYFSISNGYVQNNSNPLFLSTLTNTSRINPVVFIKNFFLIVKKLRYTNIYISSSKDVQNKQVFKIVRESLRMMRTSQIKLTIKLVQLASSQNLILDTQASLMFLVPSTSTKQTQMIWPFTAAKES